jgi:hypothetical protein
VELAFGQKSMLWLLPILLWDMFFPMPHVSAFSMQMGQRYVVADFPKTDVKQGLKFIHSPEYWANGMSLALGVPRFRMRNVSPVVFCGEDRMITFFAKGQQVAMMSSKKEKVVVKVGNHSTIVLRVHEHEWSEGGFSLLVDIKSMWLTNETRDWDQCARKFLEVSLLGLQQDLPLNVEDELHLRRGDEFLDAYRSLVFQDDLWDLDD